MPWESKKQQRWGHGKGGKKAGFSEEKIKEWDDKTDFDSLPEEAAQAGKGPTRRQGPGKAPQVVRDVKKVSRESDPHKGKRRGGFHSPPKGKKQYTRKEKHTGQSNSQSLTPQDETYRQMNFPIAKLNWSTHKPETFKDTGEKGLHPAWGLKSIIDRGVKAHEKPSGDKRIGEGEHQTQKRDIDSKSFRSYSMVHAFVWDLR